MEIKYVDYGLANNLGDVIEVNENLKNYPNLYNPIMQHELKHTKLKGFTKDDLLIDFEETNLNYWDLFKFMLKYPRSFLQLSPFYIKNKTFYYDINMILTWLASIVIIGSITYLILK